MQLFLRTKAEPMAAEAEWFLIRWIIHSCWGTIVSPQLDGLEVAFTIYSNRIPTDNHAFCSVNSYNSKQMS